MKQYTNWLSLSLTDQLMELGFSIVITAQTRTDTYVIYKHANRIVVITERSKESLDQQIYVVRNGFSLYIYNDQISYAGSIIKANMDSDFEWCENPVDEIEEMITTLGLSKLINN